VRFVDVDKCPFRPHNDEELFGYKKYHIFNVIRELMYFAYCTRLDIVFAVNLLSNI